MSEPLSPAEMDEIIRTQFPAGFLAKAHRRLPLSDVIYAHGPLGPEHIKAVEEFEASGAVLPFNPNSTVRALRHTHHRLAQMLAGGMDETIAAKLCNYTVQRVSCLKADPAFSELLAHYTAKVDDEFTEFATAAANLTLDMMGRLQQMLDEEPEKFGPGHLMDAIKLLADRTGHAPVTKSLNINVNQGLGDRLRAARERANSAYLLPPAEE